jgi:hypothetical protein
MSETASSIPGTSSRRASRSRFFPVMATVVTLIVFAGFSNTFYFRALTGAEGNIGTGPLPTQVIVHGVVFSIWILLFFSQAWLIASHRIGLHRALGYAGAFSALTVVVAGALTTVFFVPRAVAAGIETESITGIFTGNFISLISFAIFVGLALMWRRNAANHKRLMYFATLSILSPALAGLNRPLGAFLGQFVPSHAIVVITLLILAVIVFDQFGEGRLRKVTIWGGVAIIAKFAINGMLLAPNAALQGAVLSLA